MTSAEWVARIDAIAACGADVDESALECLHDALGEPVKAVQRRAADAFAQLGAAGVPVCASLTALLSAASFAQRWGATYALSKLGDPPAAMLPVLLEAMATDDGDLRWAAARIVVDRMGAPDLSARLLEHANASSPELRKMVVYCLRDLGVDGAKAEACYRRAIADTAAGVRFAGMSALSRAARNRDAAAERIAGLLDDSDVGVRRAAAGTLGQFGVSSAVVVQGLRAAAGSSDPYLARAARRALERLGVATEP